MHCLQDGMHPEDVIVELSELAKVRKKSKVDFYEALFDDWEFVASDETPLAEHEYEIDDEWTRVIVEDEESDGVSYDLLKY